MAATNQDFSAELDLIEEMAKLAKEHGIRRLRVGEVELEMSADFFLTSSASPSEASREVKLTSPKVAFVRPSFVTERPQNGAK